MTDAPAPSRTATWLDRWGGILPLLVAEFVVWLGFGGLLPVLPLYFTEQGLDFATLGLVVAAWPAARLVSEPIFGWLADRSGRVPLMVIGLLTTGILGALPLVFTGALPFLLLRAGAGVGAAIYDPAARGYLTDATPPGRRGEAFGLYGAAQMGGLLLGPAIGAFGADRFGGIGFVFVFSAIAAVVAALAIALRVRETPVRTHPAPSPDSTEFPPDSASLVRRAADDVDADRDRAADPDLPASLWNRGLIAVIVINAGGYFAGGTYEVIWSIFLQGLGASLGLIGLTFAMFGLPVLLFSPFAGRLVDRRGSFAFIVIGSVLPAVCGLALHAHPRPDPGRAAHPGRGDRLRVPEPGALRGGRRELAGGPLVDDPGPVRGGRHARVHHRVAPRRRARGVVDQVPVLRLHGRPAELAGDRPADRRTPSAGPDRLTESGSATTIRERGGAAAARRAHNPKVTGSNPVPATKTPFP